MAHPRYLREKARALRTERKLTIDELAERLALPRTTIYYWVRDLRMERHRRANMGQRRGNRAMRRNYERLREAAYQRGAAEFAQLAGEPSFRDFVCLYIAEGYKRDRNRVSIGNSDAAVLGLAVAWMRQLTAKPLSYWLQFHVDQDLTELREFWGQNLHIEPAAVRLQRKSNSAQMNGRQWRSRYGVLSVCVNDTYLRARLEAWMDRLKAEWVQQAG